MEFSHYRANQYEMEHMIDLQCTDCSSKFSESDVELDALLCPLCGGRLEAEVEQHIEGESGQQPSNRFLGRALVAVAVFFPFIFGLALNAYVTIFPHVIRYMDGKYLISGSLLVSVALTFISTQRYLRYGVAKVLIRLPIFIIYLVVAYLLTIRSYCDPYWYGEEYDEGSGSSGCIDEKPSKPSIEKTTVNNTSSKPAKLGQ